MSESSSKQFKVTFKSDEVNVNYGGLVLVSADRKAVQDAISGVAGALGLENCLKLGAAAAAIFVTTRSIAKNLPWVEDTKVQEDNVVEITPKPGKEEKLAKLVASGGLEKIVKSDFENLDNKLDVLLGEEICEKYGEKVLELIKDIRIGSITTGRSTGIPENMAAANLILGVDNSEQQRQKNIVLDSGNSTAKGVAAGQFIGPDAKVGGKKSDGENVVIRGFDGNQTAKQLENIQGDLVKVKILGLSQPFERKFKPGTTIFQVCQEVQKVEQKYGRLQIRRGSVILSENLTMAQAEVDGSTVNWRAEFME